ncbi:MAG TPA: diguanylate cyclase [Thermoanaerobaculia bacterium]
MTKWLAVALLCFASIAGASESGSPLISLFRQEEHKAGAQTFRVRSDPRGRLWFANSEGVLTYDGAWWTATKVPGDVAFGLDVDDAGRVAAVGLDEFGIVQDGQYRSLVEQLPVSLRSGIGQPEPCAFVNGFVFAAERFVARWDGIKLIVLDVPGDGRTRRCFEAGGKLFIGGHGGLVEVATGRRSFVDRRVDWLLPAAVILRGEGLFRLDETPIVTDGSEWLRGKSVMDARMLRDGRFAIATLRHGLAILTKDYRIDRIIDARAGLPDELLFGVEQDREGALWLAFDNGIARVDVATPLTILDQRIGLRGGVYTIGRHAGRLHVATAHGVFVVEPTSEGVRARRLAGIDNVTWSLLETHGDLLVGTFGGLFVLGEPPRMIAGTENLLIYAMRASRSDATLIHLATDSGLGQLRRRGNAWVFDGMVPNTPSHIRSLAEDARGLWCGTELDGVMLVARDGSRQKFGSGDTQVLTVDGRVVLRPRRGKFSQPGPRGTLVPDPVLGHLFTNDAVQQAGVDAAQNIWIGSRPPRIARRLGNGRYEAEAHAVGGIRGEINVYFAEPDGVMWLGTDRGLYRVEPRAIAQTRPAAPAIRRVVHNDRALVNRSELPHNFGRLRIEVAPLSYRASTSYQYRLEPLDVSWTLWTNEPFRDFTTLAPGAYTFRARTRSASGVVSDEAFWSFTVLGPWYATTWATALWVALAAAIVLMTVLLWTRALRSRAEKLQRRVDTQTVALQETVEQLREAKEMLVDKNALLEVSNIRLEQANERLERLSLRDALTGVANRRYFDRALADEWDRAARRGDAIALILIDLDHFKELNDSQGHIAGDECLRRVGEYLESVVRGAGDVVARWGGEEFAVLLPNASEEEALVVAERLRVGVEPQGVTASFGVATSIDAADAQQLVERADRALYAAKRAGRNRVQLASECVRDVTA